MNLINFDVSIQTPGDHDFSGVQLHNYGRY